MAGEPGTPNHDQIVKHPSARGIFQRGCWHTALLDGVEPALVIAGHALDAFLQVDDRRLFFLPGNSPDRAVAVTLTAAGALLRVDPELKQIRALFGRTSLVHDVCLELLPEGI